MRDLGEIERGAKAAVTKGPWNAVMHEGSCELRMSPEAETGRSPVEDLLEWDHDLYDDGDDSPETRQCRLAEARMQFMAEASIDVPEMAAHIRDLRAELTDSQRLLLGAELCGACGEEWLWPGEGHRDHGDAGMVCDACWKAGATDA